MNKNLLKRDMIIGLTVVALAIVYIIITPYQVSLRNDGFGVSGRSLPHLAGLLGIIFGSWLALRNFIMLRKAQNFEDVGSKVQPTGNVKRVVIYIAIISLYLFAMQTLSFTISSMVVLYVTMKFSGAKGQVGVIAISVVTPIVLYYLFNYLMSIPMPDTLFY